jgi:hypothetical protein
MTTKAHTSGFRNFGFRHQASGGHFPTNVDLRLKGCQFIVFPCDEQRPLFRDGSRRVHWLEFVAVPRKILGARRASTVHATNLSNDAPTLCLA